MALTKVTYVDNVTVIGATNLNAIQDEIIANGTAVVNLSNGKVDKVVGKGLSTNDFSDEAALKLSNIEAGATHVEVDDDLSTSSENAIQNKAVAVELNKKISTGGAYEDLTAGNAMQIISDAVDVDQVPYAFRKTGGNLTVGKREYDKLVGGTVVWNQVVQNGNFALDAYWQTSNGTRSVSNNTLTYTRTDGTTGATQIFQLGNTIPQGHIVYGCADVKVVADSSRSLVFRIGNITGSQAVICTPNTSINIYTIKSVNASSPEINVYGPEGSEWVGGDKVEVRNACTFDLTAMFGSTIANAILAMETATAGAGVAFFRSLFPNSYYAYNAGTLMSVNAAEHQTVGFNQWDEEFEIGKMWDTTDGIKKNQENWCSCANYQPCLGGTQYYTNAPNSTVRYGNILFYDSSKNYISTVPARTNGVFTTPDNCCYFTFSVSKAQYTSASSYQNDICINLSDPAKNGTYEPYTKHTYPLDSTLTLRGLPKLDSSNKLYYDGDTYASDGTVTRRYGVVDLGTLTWTYLSDDMRFASEDIPSAKLADARTLPLVCQKYVGIYDGTPFSSIPDKSIYFAPNGNLYSIYVHDSAYTDAATFKTAMSGVYAVYELKTPTTESATPFQNPQICDPNGTEEYVDAGVAASTPTRDVAIPVGHETDYPVDLVKKIEGLPSDFSTLIAPTEKTTTASKGYSVNELLIMNNQLYKVTSNISNGGTITVGTNVTATTIGAILTQLLNA